MKYVTVSVHYIQFTFFVVIFVFMYVSEVLFCLLINQHTFTNMTLDDTEFTQIF